MYDGYTFSQQLDSCRYYCSKKDRAKCKVSVRILDDGTLVTFGGAHTHPRIKYTVNEDGLHVPVRNQD